jgi:hypothetical protein
MSRITLDILRVVILWWDHRLIAKVLIKMARMLYLSWNLELQVYYVMISVTILITWIMRLQNIEANTLATRESFMILLEELS